MWYQGWFETGTSKGTVWSGIIAHPIDTFDGNYRVAYTDYEKFAIVYSCMENFNPNLGLTDKENITILSRKPEVSEDDEKFLKEEVEKLFQAEGDRKALKFPKDFK